MWKIETERGDLFDVNMMITMEVKARGQFNKEEVIEAFNNAIKSFEILNTKIIIDDHGLAFYKENDYKDQVGIFLKVVDENNNPIINQDD